jgi:hypothetical protein
MPTLPPDEESASRPAIELPSLFEHTLIASLIYPHVPGDYHGSKPVDAAEEALVLWEECAFAQHHRKMTPEQITMRAAQQRQHSWYKDLIEPVDQSD